MSSAVFADAYYYLALINPRDSAHDRACRATERLSSPVVTTAWIIQELADGLSAPPGRSAFLRLLSSLETDTNTEIVSPEPALWHRGVVLYRSRPDKSWSTGRLYLVRGYARTRHNRSLDG